jgi:hypothetical protein
MNIYENEDYKQCLRFLMSERQQQFGSRFTFEKMALACGVQKTYLSKVLNSSAHLNPDQLFAACEFLKLSLVETEFMLLLRESEVVVNSTRSHLLKGKIAEFRKDNLKTESAIQIAKEGSVESNKWEYYTDVDLQLVHMFMTIPNYARDPNQICQQIGISAIRLQAILLKLENWQIVRFQGGSYQVNDPKLHLPEDSPVFLAFGILKRVKTIEKIRQSKVDKNDDYFFSVIFSASKKLQGKFKRKLLDVLKELQGEVIDSKSEEIYQLNIDFLKWS